MQKRVKTTLLWNGTDFGWAGSDSLIIDLLSNAQRYMRAITTFTDVRKIPTKDELNAHFSDVTKQFIEYMRWAYGAVLDPQRVSGIKIKLDSVRGLPKFSLKYQKSESVTVVYVFRISNKYGGPIATLLKESYIGLRNDPIFLTEKRDVHDTKSIKEMPATDLPVENIVTSPDIASRDSLGATMTKNSFVLVIDASADPTVDTGGALYYHDVVAETWTKIAEYVAISDVDGSYAIVKSPTHTLREDFDREF